MKPINQIVYNEMLKIGLLKPEVIRGEFGNVIKVKDKETGRIKTLINRKVQISNKHKSSKAKTYFVEEPIYKNYLKIIEEQNKK